jgi:Protein of unknown function (DUF2934)
MSTATTETMMQLEQREQAVRERAYAIWEQDGHPDGKELDHWLRAEAKIISGAERTKVLISQSYLLDTSAFIALRRFLKRLQGCNLYVSPYVFWERLCHLDEHEDFERAKDEFRKFKFVKILNDPRVGIEPPSLSSEAGCASLLYAVLAELEASKSLESFYSKQFRDSKNNVRQISGCVEEVRNVLNGREERYVAFVREVMQTFSRTTVVRMDEVTKHTYIMALAKGYPGVEITDTYIYFSYIFHRAITFLKNGHTEPPKKEKNDYEDGRICLHLKLDTPYCLVTNDNGTKEALKETASLLRKLDDPQFQTTLETCDANDLKTLE